MLERLKLSMFVMKLKKSLMKSKLLKPMVLEFYKTVEKACIQAVNICSKNTLLKMSWLNPWQGSIQICVRCLKITKDYYHLNNFFEHFLSKESPSDFPAELKYVLDSDLPQLQNSELLDVWWNKVFEAKRYPMRSSILTASLSIFTGPMVESLFSMMDDIDSRSGRIEVNTYRAIMTFKYQLK